MRRLTVFVRVNFVLGAMYPLVFAELYALTVLMNAQESTGDPRPVMAAIVWAIVALTVAGVIAENTAPSNERKDDTEDPPDALTAIR